MVKCSTSGCGNVAYYGQFYGRPTVCKVHAGADAKSVARKCNLDGCLMAATSTKTPMCDRCARMYDEIDAFRLAKLRDLATQYGVEASGLGQQHGGDSAETKAKPPAKVSTTAPASGLVVAGTVTKPLAKAGLSKAASAPPQKKSESATATFADSAAPSTTAKVGRPPRAKTPGRGLGGKSASATVSAPFVL